MLHHDWLKSTLQVRDRVALTSSRLDAVAKHLPCCLAKRVSSFACPSFFDLAEHAQQQGRGDLRKQHAAHMREQILGHVAQPFLCVGVAPCTGLDAMKFTHDSLKSALLGMGEGELLDLLCKAGVDAGCELFSGFIAATAGLGESYSGIHP